MALIRLNNQSLTAVSALPAGVGGNILEQVFLNCNGDTVTVNGTNYTSTDVTAAQALTDTHADVTGSSISYTPPSGATLVVYELNYMMRGTSANNLVHVKMLIDSDEVTQARKTLGGGSSAYDSEYVSHKWGIAIGGSADTASGRQASWTSAKTIKLQARRYSSSYTGELHSMVFWDGAGSTQVIRPTLMITALG